MYRNLVIGLGEVGTAVFRVLSETDITFGRDLNQDYAFDNINVMHICFPWSPSFIDEVKKYKEQYNPGLIIVYSSVPIGTCESIGMDIVHSPIEGKHPQLENSVLLFTRWIGCMDDKAREEAAKFWYRIVRQVSTVKSSRYTEALKLLSTSTYGVNLVWADYEKELADEIGMQYDCIKEYNEGYNKLYRDIGMFQYQRYILDPPNGKIGGHCVVPNAELLDKQYPTPMLKAIKKMKERK